MSRKQILRTTFLLSGQVSGQRLCPRSETSETAKGRPWNSRKKIQSPRGVLAILLKPSARFESESTPIESNCDVEWIRSNTHIAMDREATTLKPVIRCGLPRNGAGVDCALVSLSFILE